MGCVFLEEFAEALGFGGILATDDDAAGGIFVQWLDEFGDGFFEVFTEGMEGGDGERDVGVGGGSAGGELVDFGEGVEGFVEEFESGRGSADAARIEDAFVVAAGLFDDFESFGEEDESGFGEEIKG